MSFPSSKKIKLSSEKEEGEMVSTGKDNLFKTIVLYIHPNAIGPKTLEVMKRSAIKNGFTLSSTVM